MADPFEVRSALLANRQARRRGLRWRCVVTDTEGLEHAVLFAPVRIHRWRCTTCETRTVQPHCGHTRAAAHHLAEHLLGLNPQEIP